MDFFSRLIEFVIRLLPRVATVEPNEAGVFLRFGRFKKELLPGMYFCFPLVDLVRKLDIMPQVINLPDQAVTSSDGKTYAVSGAVEYSIKDVRKALLHVQNFDASLQNLAMGAIFEFINKRTSDCIKGDELNQELSKAVRASVHKWGLDVTAVYLHEFGECKMLRVMSEGNPKIVTIGE